MAWEEEAANRWVTVDNAVPDVLPNPRAEDPNENCRETEEAAGVTWDGFKCKITVATSQAHPLTITCNKATNYTSPR